jgi:dihydropteroate synthase
MVKVWEGAWIGPGTPGIPPIHLDNMNPFSDPLASVPSRAGCWKLRSRALTLCRQPLMMGIINVTPDSFSDGGKYLDKSAALEHGLRLAAEGADILDIGGQSTRPYSEPVDVDEELRRVIPVVDELSRETSLPISIDTARASVAREAADAGAQIVNDVTALSGDDLMVETVAELGLAVCVMHMQGTPQTMQIKPTYDDVVSEIREFLGRRREQLIEAGIDPERIAVDPGIGFGKTHQHNLKLLSNAWRFHELGSPVLVGHSRKTFIGKVLGDEDADRTAGTIGVAMSLARQGVQILRIHDVGPVRRALMLHQAAGGLG